MLPVLNDRPRNLALEGLRDIGHRTRLEHLGIDYAHAAGDVDFLLNAISDDDSAFKQLRIIF